MYASTVFFVNAEYSVHECIDNRFTVNNEHDVISMDEVTDNQSDAAIELVTYVGTLTDHGRRWLSLHVNGLQCNTLPVAPLATLHHGRKPNNRTPNENDGKSQVNMIMLGDLSIPIEDESHHDDNGEDCETHGVEHPESCK
jgi:hypothetical protein